MEASVRILAAEDNATNRFLLQTLLDEMGLTAYVVADGVQAVEAARLAVFDLVLMDLQMPVMGGLDAARAIRAGGGPNADIPIIALTATTGALGVAACCAAGMTGHVAKPIDPAALYAAIAAALRREPAAEVGKGLARAGEPR
jgi:two-component system, sensor histidine kinase